MFERRAVDRIQHVERHGTHAERADFQRHIDAVLHRLAEADDAAAANAEACVLRCLQHRDLVIVFVRSADLRKEAARSLEIVVDPFDACLF